MKNSRIAHALAGLRWILFSSILIVSAHAANVCNDPAFIMKADSDVFRLQQAFNAGPGAKRVFDEVHYIIPGDPNLTVGMGHWTGGKLARLFRSLREDQATWEELTKTWADTMDISMWKAFEQDAGKAGRDSAAVSKGLETLLCAETVSRSCVEKTLLPWSHRTKDAFNGKGHWFHAGWRSVARLPSVATRQVQFWVESVVADGQANAEERGVNTKGGSATVISATSSGLTTMFKPGAKRAIASSEGNSLQQPLNEVPTWARPSGQVDEKALLADWRSLVAWQFYNVKKRRVRSRMTEIWKLYYEPTWGSLPERPKLSDVLAERKHTGCYMASGPLDISPAVDIPDPLDCGRDLPIPQPVSCRNLP